jgi:excisionase family DNA binding protein
MTGMVYSQSELLKVPEVASLLQIGRSKVWELVWSGDLPVVRIGRLVRVPRSRLAQWVEERTVRVTEGTSVTG